MTIASAEKLRSASSRAWSGSPSPISPRTRSPAPSKCLEGRLEALGSGFAGAVLVGRPGANPGVEGGADDEDILGHPVGHPHDLVAKPCPCSVSFAITRTLHVSSTATRSTCSRGGCAALPSPQHGERSAREHEEDDEREPGRDQRRDHDQREVDDRAEDEAERRILALERVLHEGSPSRRHS